MDPTTAKGTTQDPQQSELPPIPQQPVVKGDSTQLLTQVGIEHKSGLWGIFDPRVAVNSMLNLLPMFRKPTEPMDNGEANKLKSLTDFAAGMVDIRDVIAPSAIEVDFDFVKINQKLYRTYFSALFPRFVTSNWLSPLINFEKTLDISMFYYPVDSRVVMQKLRRKIAEMEATLNTLAEQGKVSDPNVQVALNDAKDLQEQLAKGSEKFFHYALYITIQADTINELNDVGKNLESILGASGLVVKSAYLQQEFGFQATLPENNDKLSVIRNMDTTSIATTFPFVSSDLTSDTGILFGINRSNKSLVIYDRFSSENYNTVIFARSGAGKSYLAKLEALRSLMLGSQIIIIDPEREYEKLTEVLGGAYISFSQDGLSKVNPFDLSGVKEEGEDELRFKILSLHGLFRIMLGGTGDQLSSIENAVLDKALIATYREKGITTDPATQTKEPPLLEDLFKVLQGMEEPEAQGISKRLERYIKGSASGIFDQATNVEIDNPFTVFSIKDLSDELRPTAMYLMLDYIWTRIKKKKERRILMVDEAWILMKYPDSAQFMNAIAKRARKYYLGLTTITQDVEDFLSTDYGKAIVNNASMQILLKQSPSAIDNIQKVFFLSEGEKDLLLNASQGEGLFFAGANHVAIQVVASQYEHSLITTNPVEMEKVTGTATDQVVTPE
jgi:conjugal transfer ATP-binding protein TraC